MSRFDHVEFDEHAQKTLKNFKDAFTCLDGMISHLSNGRAKSLVLTHMEETYMWVGKAIRDDQLKRNEQEKVTKQ